MTACMMVGLLLTACGDAGADPLGEDTDGSSDSSGDGSSTEEPSTSSTGEPEPGTDGSTTTDTEPGSTGDAEGTTTTGEEPEPGLDVESYRITWTSFESTVHRLYTANGDFSDRVSLTSVGVDGVAMDTFHERPKMHPDGRTLGFVRGSTLMSADVSSGETHPLTYDGTPVRRFAWAPSDRRVAWIDDAYRFRVSDWDAGTSEEVRDLAGDGLDADQIPFAWSPLQIGRAHV